jgi:hypothetical protein
VTDSPDEYIPLDRTFHELTLDAGAGDDLDPTRFRDSTDPLRWSDLLKNYRVIILSEAGSGKTTEIRTIARELRREGKPAFFLRIEHVSQDFEDAFEEGTLEEFSAWAASGDEGWLLLDSVDEARLRDPKDFERAIKKLGRMLMSVLQQAHIVITGRTTAWRPKTDLMLCRAELPYKPVERAADVEKITESSRDIFTKKADARKSPPDPFRVVALDDLHGAQIEAFVRGKTATDFKAFRNAVDRKEAWSLTTRPQDLAELVEFWIDHKRIGSRLELMQRSITRRLEERDQDRADARPIAVERLRLGARLAAAATTLTQQSAIRVPDGVDNTKGIPIREVLTDWNDVDCLTLLSRPIFDEGIYGTVRFHHRSVREYLTAEWLHGLIVDEGSRVRIENLFFRSQYGIEVIVPSMRPILPWLAILDKRILARLCRLAPEVIFEGGDPSQLPLDTRRTILRQACEQLAQPTHSRSLTNYAAVQGFATEDITDDIKALLIKHGEDEDIACFLLRMVWQGEIRGAAAEVKHLALRSLSRYTRIAAFHALGAVGSPTEQADLSRALLTEATELDRELIAEIIPGIPQSDEGITRLVNVLQRARPAKRFQVDSLTRPMLQLVAEWPLSMLAQLVSGLHVLLEMHPFTERQYHDDSVQCFWLMQVAAESALRLIAARDPGAIWPDTLSVLRKITIAMPYGDHELRDISGRLSKHVPEWIALNHALFWQDVAETRADRDKNAGVRLSDHWHVAMHGHFWTFRTDSFDLICEDIASRPLLDDKLVALNLAFAIYRENGRPADWLKNLKRLAKNESDLKSALDNLLRPPRKAQQEWRRQETRWKKQAAAQKANGEANQRQWMEHLETNLEGLRDSGKPGETNGAQHYLQQRLRSGTDHSGKWTDGNWRSLIPEFDEAIASAFRDGAVQFWRSYRPKLISEGAVANTTPFGVVFGLTGLAIEARDNPNWPTHLSHIEATLATRYALLELNGFASWLPSLFTEHPDAVINVVITEIDYELANDPSETNSHYVLSDCSWAGNWMWDRLAPLIAARLKKTPKNVAHLRHMLRILQGSSLEDTVIAKLAAQKGKTTRNSATSPMWFAMWAGVDPEAAIPALSARLAEIIGEDQRREHAMRFITALVGSNRENESGRQAYRTVEHMKTLYLLMNHHIHEKDDIDRAGGGVYSPQLRDDAQDARNALFSYIRETPGKEAFVALMEISRSHPAEASRPWMTFHAKNKAAIDADLPAWSPGQVRDFHDRLERTPTNHRDLWYLAIDRLLDLKQDLEEGDTSIASILQPVDKETEIRKYIANWCRERAAGRYGIAQEEELADAKRTDLRFLGVGFDRPVPAELKLADKWTGPHLFERLEVQLCGDYLRDVRSSRGIFLLFNQGTQASWHLPNGGRAESFDSLVEMLQSHWTLLAPQYTGIEDIKVVGIDLTRRGVNTKTAPKRKITKKTI